uniref:VWFA domain-containing protein n=1 Tax=Rhabditophanes sp. KR3021 TaxID=114890 RepID=A0AC35TPP0_9BILA
MVNGNLNVNDKRPDQSDDGCSSDLSGLYLDIVIIFDTSAGTDIQGFNGQRGAAIAFAGSGVNISQTFEQATRFAFVTAATEAKVVASLNEIQTFSDYMQKLRSITYRSNTGPKLDISKALSAAEQIIQINGRGNNVKKLIVLFTSATDYNCPNDSDQFDFEAESPCRIAQTIKNKNINILTIRLNFNDAPNLQKNGIASPCYALDNDVFMMPNFIKLAAYTNCFCPSQYQHFEEKDLCFKSNQCLYLENTPTTYMAAQQVADMDGGALVNIQSSLKQKFVANYAKTTLPIFIGLNQIQTSSWHWDYSNTDLDLSSDYQNFAEGAAEKGGCAYMELNGLWNGIKCNSFVDAHPYVYQIPSCDASRFLIIFDSSEDTDQLGFNGQRGAALAFISTKFQVSQTIDQATRIAIITAATESVVIGDLNLYNSIAEVTKGIRTLSYTANTGKELDVYKTLKKANLVIEETGRDCNTEKLIILFTSAEDIDCLLTEFKVGNNG